MKSKIIIFIASFFIIPIFCQEIDVATSGIFELRLEDLMEIKVVTANKELEKIKDVPASVVVITAEEIQTLGYFVFDSNIGWKNIKNSTISLSLNIKNMENNETCCPTMKSNSWIDNGYLALGRQYIANINYEI